jgi:acyl-[acyl-carrier-protein]-phospholipid O-acyltransferase/long-chain-fatty-acid--[acyl-carrier-protein] ligase
MGVVNNNLLKGLICFICIKWVSRENESGVLMLSSALLVLPYIIFSPLAGRLAKTKLKTSVVLLAKKVEILIMLLAFCGLFLQSLPVVLSALFLLGLQSALFSPSKFGLIRDIGGNENVSYGTGVMDMLSFLGVLIATFTAGIISDMLDYQLSIIALLFITISINGWISALKIKATEPPLEKAERSVNPFVFIRDSFSWAKSVKGLNYIILGSAIFWFMASLVQLNLIIYCPSTYNMSNTQTSIVMALIAIGVALGCWVSGFISRGSIKLAMIPIGGFVFSTLITLIAVIKMPSYLFTLLMFLFAFFCGMYKITINTWLQRNVEGREQGNMLAFGNIVDFIFVLIASGLFRIIDVTFDNIAVFICVAVSGWVITFITLFKVPGTYVTFIKLIRKLFFIKN